MPRDQVNRGICDLFNGNIPPRALLNNNLKELSVAVESALAESKMLVYVGL
jgi:hypothetical protein